MVEKIKRLLRKAAATLFIAALAAAIITVLWEQSAHEDFETAVARAAVVNEARKSGICPLNSGATEREDIALISICATYGFQAYVAAKRYPDIAPELFATYGELPEFHTALDRYESAVLPVIQYFRENGSTAMRARVGVASALKKIWRSLNQREPIGSDIFKMPELTTDEYGYIAVQEIVRNGHRLLSEFEYVNGTGRKWTPRAMNFVYDVFVGGISDLEAAIVRGEKVTWKHAAWATLDVAIIVGGASVVVKSIKAAKTAKVATATVKTPTLSSKFSAVGAKTLAGAKIVGSIAKPTAKAAFVASPFAFGYVAVTRPDLILSGGAWLAKYAEVEEWIGVYAVALIASLLFLSFAWAAWRIIRPFIAPFAFLVIQGTKWATKTA